VDEAGDTVEVEVSKVGVLVNTIRPADPGSGEAERNQQR